MTDKGQTSSKHQKASGEKKRGKIGWVSRNGHKNGGNRNQPKTEYERRPNETYDEYLESLKEKKVPDN